jgi:hypothetical protein
MRLSQTLATLLVAPSVVLTGGVPASALQRAAPPGIAVRYSEGTVHGFVELRNTADSLLAYGSLLQVPRDSGVESRLVFYFPDSSVFRETVTFSQHGVFRLHRYQLVQRGPAFAQDLDVDLSRTGQYTVTTKSRENGREERQTGKLDLPPDVYNGMIITVAKNLAPRARATVSVVAFTPKPLIIGLEIAPSGTHRLAGTLAGQAVRYTLKPKLNLLLRIGAQLKGQTPPDSHLWIVTDEVPAFVRFEGPLYSGPVWRINLTSPRWPK